MIVSFFSHTCKVLLQGFSPIPCYLSSLHDSLTVYTVILLWFLASFYNLILGV
jgi:hypothetical protein